MTIRALGGALFEGDKLVRLAYFDEAGVSRAREEPFLVVSGVLIHGDNQLARVEQALDTLVEKHVPKEQRDGFIFHAFHLFGGTGPFDEKRFPYWTSARRLALAEDLSLIPKKFHLPIAFGWVERAKFPRTFTFPPEAKEREKVVRAHVTAYMSCAMQMEQVMRREHKLEHCIAIVEDNDDARTLIQQTQRHHQDKKLAAQLEDEAKIHFPFRKIKHSPLIEKKAPSSPLQVADFCAYVFKRLLMDQDHQIYLKLYGAMKPQIAVTDTLVR